MHTYTDSMHSTRNIMHMACRSTAARQLTAQRRGWCEACVGLLAIINLISLSQPFNHCTQITEINIPTYDVYTHRHTLVRICPDIDIVLQ